MLQYVTFVFHDVYIQIDSSTPSCNISVINDVMKVGKLAVDIDTQDVGSGVQSVDLLYQISDGNGKSVVIVVVVFLFVFFINIFIAFTLSHTKTIQTHFKLSY